MTRRGLAIIFGVVFFGFLVAGLPLNVVAGFFGSRAGLWFEDVSGTVWNGTFRNAALGGRRLGTLNLSFNPLYLALGRIHLEFSFDGPDGVGRGILESGLGSYVALRDATMRVRVENVPSTLDLSGTVSLDAVSLILDGGVCRTAQGGVTTDILARNAATLGWEGPMLEGTIECRDGALHVPVAGSRGSESVSIEASLFADRRYEARVAVTTEDPKLLQVLPASGFSNEEGVLALVQYGRWAGDQAAETSLGG